MMLVRMNLNAGKSITYIILSNGLTGLVAIGMSLILIFEAKKQNALEAGSV